MGAIIGAGSGGVNTIIYKEKVVAGSTTSTSLDTVIDITNKSGFLSDIVVLNSNGITNQIKITVDGILFANLTSLPGNVTGILLDTINAVSPANVENFNEGDTLTGLTYPVYRTFPKYFDSSLKVEIAGGTTAGIMFRGKIGVVE